MIPRRWRLGVLVTAAAGGLVRLILRAHPREFRRRFGADLLAAVDDDLRQAATLEGRAAGRAATSAVVDALAGLGASRGAAATPTDGLTLFEERTHMQTWVRDAWADLRLALRAFRREPAWCAAVVLTLALGIGLNAAMFGVADRLLFSGPEHVHDPGHVGRIQMTRQPPGQDVQYGGQFGYALYDALRRNAHSFAAIGGYSVYVDGDVLGRAEEARRINHGEATASLFPLLGVTPAAGRFFTEREDDTVAPEHVVVIGYDLWQREFAGRPDAVGRPIVLNNETYTIVGVAPSGFTGPDLERVDVWYPESLMGRWRIRTNWTQSWNSQWLSIIVRLKPGALVETAGREATAILRQAAPPTDKTLRAATMAVRPLTYGRDGVESMEARVSTWLAAVAGIVLVVSCANVVNLVLARGFRRRREIAVRLALGATRGRLLRLLTAEAIALAVIGGAVGLGVAWLVGTLMRTWLIPSVAWTSGPVNGRVLALSTLVSLLAGFVVGLVPAWRASAPDVSSSLKTGVREGGGRRSRARATLTIVQAALSALLLVGSGLFVASLARVRALDLGLQPDRVLIFGVLRTAIPATDDAATRQLERDRRAAFYPAVLNRLEQQPDVEAASLTVGLAFWTGFGEDIRVPGLDRIPQLKGGGPFLSAVTADYFKTVGTRILRGRAFTTSDRAGSAPVAIVNETMARTLWPGKDAIGQCFTVVDDAPACAEIVGIAANTRHFKLREDESLSFYIPFGQEVGIGGTTLIVRPRGEPTQVLASIRKELVDIDPSITYVTAQVLQDQIEPQVRPWALGATMFSLMGVLALVVAGVGLYSVMSYLVTSRAHEIGVRMALGARPANVSALVIRGGLVLAVAGIAVGFGLALLSAHLVEPLLFDTSPRDPRVYALVAVTLTAMALLAAVLPAARARRINPIEAMRED